MKKITSVHKPYKTSSFKKLLQEKPEVLEKRPESLSVSPEERSALTFFYGNQAKENAAGTILRARHNEDLLSRIILD